MGTELVLGNVQLSTALYDIDSRLEFIERLCQRILVVQKERKDDNVKSYHWVTVVVVLVVAYLIGVKYPSIGASALSKVGL